MTNIMSNGFAQETETGQAVANVRALTYCEIIFNNFDLSSINSKAKNTRKNNEKKYKNTKIQKN